MSNLAPNTFSDARAIGYVSWNVNPYSATAAAAASNQEVQAVGLWVPYNVPIGNIYLNVTTAGTSTAPTGFFVAIGNGTKILRQSVNLAASGNLIATGIAAYALTAPYTPVPSDAEDNYFYVAFLQNGAFAGTNVQFARTGGIQIPPTGFKITAGRAGTAQTALPANGATYSTALAAAGGQNWFVGVGP